MPTFAHIRAFHQPRGNGTRASDINMQDSERAKIDQAFNARAKAGLAYATRREVFSANCERAGTVFDDGGDLD